MEDFKTIIPAAGLGSRFFPYTKAIPKEMLPLINKPAIQLVIEECIAAQLKDIILVINSEKSVIREHFAHDARLNTFARERNKLWPTLDELDEITKGTSLTFIQQPEPLGLGHAIWLARQHVEAHYFGICLPDDIIFSEVPGIQQLFAIAQQRNASVIAVQEVPRDMIWQYGVIGIKSQINESLFEVSHLVEKPSPQDAPSALAVVGRYVLSPKIFTALENMSTYAHEELQLTNAISHMVDAGETLLAYKIQGTRYDIGTPAGWLKAIVDYAWNDPRYSTLIKDHLSHLYEHDHRSSQPDDMR